MSENYSDYVDTVKSLGKKPSVSYRKRQVAQAFDSEGVRPVLKDLCNDHDKMTALTEDLNSELFDWYEREGISEDQHAELQRKTVYRWLDEYGLSL